MRPKRDGCKKRHFFAFFDVIFWTLGLGFSVFDPLFGEIIILAGPTRFNIGVKNGSLFLGRPIFDPLFFGFFNILRKINP